MKTRLTLFSLLFGSALLECSGQGSISLFTYNFEPITANCPSTSAGCAQEPYGQKSIWKVEATGGASVQTRIARRVPNSPCATASVCNFPGSQNPDGNNGVVVGDKYFRGKATLTSNTSMTFRLSSPYLDYIDFMTQHFAELDVAVKGPTNSTFDVRVLIDNGWSAACPSNPIDTYELFSFTGLSTSSNPHCTIPWSHLSASTFPGPVPVPSGPWYNRVVIEIKLIRGSGGTAEMTAWLDNFNISRNPPAFMSPIGSGTTKALDRSSFSVAPNPTNGSFSLFTPEVAPNTPVQVIAADGRVVSELFTNDTFRLEIDITNQPTGVYLVRLNTGTELKTVHVMRE